MRTCVDGLCEQGTLTHTHQHLRRSPQAKVVPANAISYGVFSQLDAMFNKSDE